MFFLLYHFIADFLPLYFIFIILSVLTLVYVPYYILILNCYSLVIIQFSLYFIDDFFLYLQCCFWVQSTLILHLPVFMFIFNFKLLNLFFEIFFTLANACLRIFNLDWHILLQFFSALWYSFGGSNFHLKYFAFHSLFPTIVPVVWMLYFVFC